MNTTHSIQTPRGVAGAIGMIRLQGDDLQETLAILGIQPVAAHGVQVRSFMGIDSGVLAWWGEDSIMLMPHGGVAVVRAISDELEARGIRHEESHATYPEAHDEYESRMLDTMSCAASPLAVDLLLQQPERWRSGCEEHPDSQILNRLITPPIVAGIGRANIGKSSLLNALAGAHVALVADHAGTTRDHVGVRVDLGGLVVHWVDTPGIDESIADDGSIEIAMQMIRSASLVVHCLDCVDAMGGQSGGLIGTIDPRLAGAIGDETPVVRALTRCDQIPEGVRNHDPDTIWTSAKTGSGIEDLVRRIREGLVPAHLIADPRPWRFWND